MCHGTTPLVVPEWHGQHLSTSAPQDLLLNVVASAFYYNTSLAMGALRQAGAVQPAFAAWLGGVNAPGKHFRRLYDKKVRSDPSSPGALGGFLVWLHRSAGTQWSGGEQPRCGQHCRSSTGTSQGQSARHVRSKPAGR